MSSRILLFAVTCIVSAIGTYVLASHFEQSATGELRSRSGLDRRGSGSGADFGAVPPAVRGSAAPATAGVTATATTATEQALRASLDAAAASTDPGDRRRQVLRIGEQWAGTDPQSALAHAATLPPALRADYRASVAAEWANLDPDGFLAYVEQAPEPEQLTAGLERLIASVPSRVFEVATLMAGDLVLTSRNPLQRASALQTAAIRALAGQDPNAAIQQLASIPPGPARDSMLSGALFVFGQRMPDAALAWLDAQDRPSNAERWAVIRGIAAADFVRGYALTATEERPPSLWSFALVSDPTETAELASRLLGYVSPRADEILQSMVQRWARVDPERVVGWVTENSASVDSSLIQAVGRILAEQDFERAIAYLPRLPAEMRDTWIAEIARPFAARDPVGALAWVAQYQGQRPYQYAHSQIVTQAAQLRPELVATMFPTLPPALQTAVASRVAFEWAKQDVGAAMDWALALEGGAADSNAVGLVMSRWLRNDPERATAWAVSLPKGQRRDRAVHAVVSDGNIADPRPLLDTIDSDGMLRTAKQRAAANPATAPAIAKELLRSMVDDPEVGRWAREGLQWLEAASP